MFQSLDDPVLSPEAQQVILMKRNTHQNGIGQDKGQTNPDLGNYLGEFTSELGKDDHIVEFVSGGPKNYGYTTKKGKVECKVRGFRLNSEGKSQLNYNVMRQNVLDEIQKPLLKPRHL